MHDQENDCAKHQHQQKQQKEPHAKQGNRAGFRQHHGFHKPSCKFFIPSVTDEKLAKGYKKKSEIRKSKSET
jgi:hypothetical protein